jgi:hypothetical protein
MGFVYLLETDILEERTEYTIEHEAIVASYHYPDFIVKVYEYTNGVRVEQNFYFKGGVKKFKNV